nr:MAG TPA: hypothetical protein [Caudoviricetes sp.]
MKALNGISGRTPSTPDWQSSLEGVRHTRRMWPISHSIECRFYAHIWHLDPRDESQGRSAGSSTGPAITQTHP